MFRFLFLFFFLQIDPEDEWKMRDVMIYHTASIQLFNRLMRGDMTDDEIATNLKVARYLDSKVWNSEHLKFPLIILTLCNFFCAAVWITGSFMVTVAFGTEERVILNLKGGHKFG